jgi:hypothetical protein
MSEEVLQSPISAMGETGVLLSVLRELRDAAVRLEASVGPTSKGPRFYGSQSNPRPAGEPLTTNDVCEEIIKPRTARRQVAYLDTLDKAAVVGNANVFVS